MCVQSYRLPLTAYRLPLTAYRLPLTAYRLPLTAYRSRFHKSVLERLAIGLEPQAGPRRDLHDVVLGAGGIHEQHLADRLHVEVELDAPAVHEPRHRVHVVQRPSAAVRDRQIERLREMARFLRLGVAAAIAHVRLQDVHR